jgi:hypothetical protein
LVEWTGRGNRSTGMKPIPMIFCPIRITHDLTWDRTRAHRGGKSAPNIPSHGMRISHVPVFVWMLYCLLHSLHSLRGSW